METSKLQALPALLTLRAYRPAPARVELAYRPASGRLLRTLLCLAVFWGAIPLLVWVPPHYPWALGAFCAGAFLAHRSWTGRYRIHAFAGICPRCGRSVSLGVDRIVDLPHALTCFHCHFEPLLEVVPAGADPGGALPAHYDRECVGRWGLRWLADAPFLVCERCRAHSPATAAARAAAEAENGHADLLRRLTDEGKPLL